MTAPWTSICAQEGTDAVTINDVCEDNRFTSISPVDQHVEEVQRLLQMGDQATLQMNPTLGRLLMIGLVGSTETYFRHIVVGTLGVCKFSRQHAARQTLPFGAMEYYDQGSVALAIYEHVSFASFKEIKNRTNALLGFEIKDHHSVTGALREYDKLCELRHACAHSNGLLGLGNMLDLGAIDPSQVQRVRVSFGGLQTSAAICYNAVRAYNRHVYREVVERWIGRGVFSGVWAADRQVFSPLFNLFHSRRDSAGASNPYLAYRALPKP